MVPSRGKPLLVDSEVYPELLPAKWQMLYMAGRKFVAARAE